MASLPGSFSLQEFTDGGNPLVSGRLYTHTYGTTSFKAAFTDYLGTIPHTYTSDGLGGQYIALDARGEIPAPLYLATGSYDITLKRADGSIVWTRRADPSDDAPASALAAAITQWIAPLATSIGASLIGWIQAGIGAIHRTIQSKLRDTISVKDFGVIGDGVTDDTAAIQRAIDSLSPPSGVFGSEQIVGGGTLYFPLGVYKVTSTLLVGPYVRLVGAGMSAWLNSALGPNPTRPQGSILLWAGIAGQGVVHFTPYVTATGLRFQDPTFATIVADNQIDNVYTVCLGGGILDMGIYCPTGAKFGVRWTAANTSRNERVYVYNADIPYIGEANWESAIEKLLATDFLTFYYGNTGQHGINFNNCWPHGGSRYGGADVITGFYFHYGAGCSITCCDFENIDVAIEGHIADGITVIAGQMERVKTLLKGFSVHGFRVLGGDLYNPVTVGPNTTNPEGVNYAGLPLITGNDIEFEINGFNVDHDAYPTGEQVFPGYWLDAAGILSQGGDVRGVIRGGLPRSGEPVIVPVTGPVVFENQDTRHVFGPTGAVYPDRLWINGSYVGAVARSATELQVLNSAGSAIHRFDYAGMYYKLNGAGLGIYYSFGTPNSVVTAPQWSLCLAEGSGIYKKTTAGGDTGWVAL